MNDPIHIAMVVIFVLGPMVALTVLIVCLMKAYEMRKSNRKSSIRWAIAGLVIAAALAFIPYWILAILQRTPFPIAG